MPEPQEAALRAVVSAVDTSAGPQVGRDALAPAARSGQKPTEAEREREAPGAGLPACVADEAVQALHVASGLQQGQEPGARQAQ